MTNIEVLVILAAAPIILMLYVAAIEDLVNMFKRWRL